MAELGRLYQVEIISEPLLLHTRGLMQLGPDGNFRSTLTSLPEPLLLHTSGLMQRIFDDRKRGGWGRKEEEERRSW